MTAMRVVLDCNIWDELSADERARARVRELCERARLEVIVPFTLYQELLRSPFRGVPAWFPTRILADSVFVLDHSSLDGARLGAGHMYTDHKGTSTQVADAVIVDGADTGADVFVSQDRRARERYARLGGHSRALDFARFRSEVLDLS